MLLRQAMLGCSLLIFVHLVHEAKANQELTLQVIASSQSHSEVLIIRQSGNETTWSYIVPSRDRAGEGRLGVDASSMRKAFELVHKQQNNVDQRQRVKVALPTVTTFSLLLIDEKGIQISMPLTHREQQSILHSKLMKLVLQEINAQQLLVKAVPMEDFFYPDSIRSERKTETGTTDSR